MLASPVAYHVVLAAVRRGQTLPALEAVLMSMAPALVAMGVLARLVVPAIRSGMPLVLLLVIMRVVAL